MCSQEETDEVLAMLEDTDDDDDDLWAGGLAPSSTKKKPAKENINIKPPPSSSTKAKKELSESELHAKALADAESSLSHKKTWVYDEVHSLDQVRWHVEKVKKGSKDKNKSKPHPCYIVEDHKQATSGLDDDAIKALNLNPEGRNNTLIRLIGCHETSKDKLQAVPASQLQSFAARCDGNIDTAGSDAEQQPPAEADDGGADGAADTSSSSTQQPPAPPPRWDPERLRLYLDSIRSQKKFADPQTGAARWRAERLFLDLFLQFVGEKQRDRELAQLQMQQQTEMEEAEEEENDHDDEDDDNNNDDDAGEQHLTLSENSNPVTQDSADDADEEMKNAAAANEKVAASRGVVQRSNTLRAGDKIQYCTVDSRFGRDKMKEARVTEIDARNSHYPITTSEDDHLPRDHKIKVLARLLRNKLKPVKDPIFSTTLKLASGTFDGVPTKSKKAAELYRQAQQELKDQFERDPDQAAAAAARDDDDSALPPKQESSSTLSPGKRKAIYREDSSINDSCHSPSKVTRQEKAQSKVQQSSDNWRKELQVLLQKNRENAKQRRANTEALGVEARALETAIALWSSTNNDSSTLDELVQQHADVGTSEQRRQFLTGNRQNLLSNNVLRELTQEWEAGLQDEQTI